MAEIDLLISKDKLAVHITGDSSLLKINESDIYSLLTKHGVIFGVKRDVISNIVANHSSITFPVLIAEGERPKNGQKGYFKLEVPQEVNVLNDSQSTDVINFRNVKQIPSVKEGQIVATIYPGTPGIPGKDVFGNQIRAYDGTPSQVRLGKNTINTNGKIYSTIDGQISVSGNMISVLPLFEIDGDLSLRTGNVDFIGSVTIRGNVPSDYVIKAGGDVSIYGIVEGAFIDAGGSIFISGGIVGFQKAVIKAKGDIITSYINQSKVYAGKNIEVAGSLLHSECYAQGNIISKNGSVIGGALKAGKHIRVKDVGNELHTKTMVTLAVADYLYVTEKNIRSEIELIKKDLQKLDIIYRKLVEKYKQTSSLSPDEILLLKKQKVTQEELNNKELLLEEKLRIIQDEIHEAVNGNIVVKGSIFPNVLIHIGKYQRTINQVFHHVKVQLDNKEISISIFSTK